LFLEKVNSRPQIIVAHFQVEGRNGTLQGMHTHRTVKLADQFVFCGFVTAASVQTSVTTLKDILGLQIVVLGGTGSL